MRLVGRSGVVVACCGTGPSGRALPERLKGLLVLPISSSSGFANLGPVTKHRPCSFRRSEQLVHAVTGGLFGAQQRLDHREVANNRLRGLVLGEGDQAVQG